MGAAGAGSIWLPPPPPRAAKTSPARGRVAEDGRHQPETLQTRGGTGPRACAPAEGWRRPGRLRRSGASPPASEPSRGPKQAQRPGPEAEGPQHSGASRKDATVFGFNNQNRKKKTQESCTVFFPVKVIILHRTKREEGGLKKKKREREKQVGARELQTSPGIGDLSAISPVELFSIYLRSLVRGFVFTLALMGAA